MYVFMMQKFPLRSWFSFQFCWGSWK